MEPVSLAIAGAQAVGSIVSGIFGANSARDAEEDARRNANQQRIESFNTQVGSWQLNEAQTDLTYDFAVASARMSRDLERAVALQSWRSQNGVDAADWIIRSTNLDIQNLSVNAQNQRDVDFQRTLQAADQRAQLRQFEQSERTYSQNTQLIAEAAAQSYSYITERLKFERAGLAIQRGQVQEGFNQSKKQAINQAKAQEARFANELKQAGLSGEDLQKAVRQRMKQFTATQDQTRREASSRGAQAAATGRQGQSANRLIQDPLNQASLALGVLGIELAFFGEERQSELLKLAAATNLQSTLTDAEREQLNIRLQSEATLANLSLTENNLREREGIFEANNNLADTRLQAMSQMNQAESNRVLRPLDQVQILDPLQTPRSFLPQPFQAPIPLAATRANRAIIPARPIRAPMPVLGQQGFTSASASGGLLLQGILGAAQSGIQAYNARPPAATPITPP